MFPSLEVIFVFILCLVCILGLLLLPFPLFVGWFVIPCLMALIPFTAFPLVDWPLHHPVIWMRWEELYIGNGADGGALTRPNGPATIFGDSDPCMVQFLSLFRLPYQIVVWLHLSDAAMLCFSFASAVMHILVCVMVPLLVNLLIWNPFLWKSLIPPLIHGYHLPIVSNG